MQTNNKNKIDNKKKHPISEKQDANLSMRNKKTHKAFGIFKKYANKDLIGKEREIVAEAIAEKYRKSIL